MQIIAEEVRRRRPPIQNKSRMLIIMNRWLKPLIGRYHDFIRRFILTDSPHSLLQLLTAKAPSFIRGGNAIMTKLDELWGWPGIPARKPNGRTIQYSNKATPISNMRMFKKEFITLPPILFKAFLPAAVKCIGIFEQCIKHTPLKRKNALKSHHILLHIPSMAGNTPCHL